MRALTLRPSLQCSTMVRAWRPAAEGRLRALSDNAGGSMYTTRPGIRLLLALVAIAAVVVLPTMPAMAVDKCLAVADGPRLPAGPLVQRAGMRLAQLKPGEVRISYVGHSTFQIDTPSGLAIATDYNDYVRPAKVPDVIT